MGPGGPQYIGKWLFVWRLGGVVLARLDVGVGSLLEPLPPEVVYCLFAYIRAKHFEFSPSYGWD